MVLTSDILEFNCCDCDAEIPFSLADAAEKTTVIECPQCLKKYGFGSSPLQKKLKLFIALCSTIRDCEEILGDANVAVDVGPNKVKVPFKLLLTRLRSTIDLKIGDKTICVSYRTEPMQVANAVEKRKKG